MQFGLLSPNLSPKRSSEDVAAVVAAVQRQDSVAADAPQAAPAAAAAEPVCWPQRPTSLASSAQVRLTALNY